MKNLKLLLLLVIFAMPAFAADIKSGDDLIAAMYKKYAGKWYKTLTFVQKTITHKPDGTSTSEIWYEAMTVPGKLRIDIDPLDKGNGILFADGKITSFREGKAGPTRPLVHPLMVLGFDVYGQPVATTVEQVKGLGIDLSTIHEERWQGKAVYVVGAKQGDLATPQFWVDKKDLLFVRLFQLGGRERKNVQETQFNGYVKAKGGWVAAEVKFFTDGKLTMTEEYSDIQAGMTLDADLWNPEKWMSVDKMYFKKK
jgi:outer membrane lipoprotein-sorting protein